MTSQSFQDVAVFPGSELELIAGFMSREGIDQPVWLMGSGLGHEHFGDIESAISLRQFDTVYRNVFRLAQRPGLGIDFGLALNLSRWGLLCAALLCSNTLGHALAIASDYRAILRSRFSLSGQSLGEVFEISLTPRPNMPFPVDEVFAYEVFLGSLKTQVSQLIGQSFRFLSIELPYPVPRHYKSYGKVCERPVRFEAGKACVTLASALMSKPLPMTNRVTRRKVLDKCQAELDRILYAQSGDMAFAVSGLLHEYEGKLPSLERIATRLNMSARTLRRKLKEANTHYRELCDRHRFQRASDLLADTELRLLEIARDCGFKDEAGFHKAFKRWVGMTPGQYRLQNGH